MRGCGVGQKVLLSPAEIASFSIQDFSRSNNYDIFLYIVLTGYFYVLFLWAITVSAFRPFESYKNLGLPLSTITFTVNNHAYSNFYEYISFSFSGILYSIKTSFFLLKYMLKFFMFKFDFNVKHRSYCSNKNMVYIKSSSKKKHFQQSMQKLLNYMLYTHDVTCNLSRWNNGGNDIYKKDQ